MNRRCLTSSTLPRESSIEFETRKTYFPSVEGWAASANRRSPNVTTPRSESRVVAVLNATGSESVASTDGPPPSSVIALRDSGARLSTRKILTRVFVAAA